MDNGLFEDDDAQAVRGLEVLPGRLYDNRVPDGTRFSYPRRLGHPGQPVHPARPTPPGQPIQPARQGNDRRVNQALDILVQTK
jgi:hypothetical protein